MFRVLIISNQNSERCMKRSGNIPYWYILSRLINDINDMVTVSNDNMYFVKEREREKEREKKREREKER